MWKLEYHQVAPGAWVRTEWVDVVMYRGKKLDTLEKALMALRSARATDLDQNRGLYRLREEGTNRIITVDP